LGAEILCVYKKRGARSGGDYCLNGAAVKGRAWRIGFDRLPVPTDAPGRCKHARLGAPRLIRHNAYKHMFLNDFLKFHFTFLGTFV
jgi:hypothetical protein